VLDRHLVFVAERHDELRDARSLIELDLHPVDHRGLTVPVRRVLEIDLLAHLEEAELAVGGHTAGDPVLDPRPHRRREAVDVESHLPPRLELHRAVGAAEDPLQRDRARRVQVGEANPELAAVAEVLLPEHLAGCHHGHPLAGVETAHDRLPDVGKVGRPHRHAVFGQVDRLRLERRPQLAPDLDHRFERDPRHPRRATIMCIAHGILRTPFAYGGIRPRAK
jgi:hypothetical protein